MRVSCLHKRIHIFSFPKVLGMLLNLSHFKYLPRVPLVFELDILSPISQVPMIVFKVEVFRAGVRAVVNGPSTGHFDRLRGLR